MINWQQPVEAGHYHQTTKHLPLSFTQEEYFGDWQTAVGQPVRRLVGEAEAGVTMALQVIGASPAAGYQFGVVPYGPTVEFWTPELVQALKPALTTLAEEENWFFIRFDPHPNPDEVSQVELKRQFKSAPLYSYDGSLFQPRLDWRLDLTPDEDDLFQAMHKKHRYHIRLAERDAVESKVVEKDLVSYQELFFQLLQLTATRGGFSVHSPEYYRSVLELGEQQKSVVLVVSTVDSQVEGISVWALFQPVGHFLFAGFSERAYNCSVSHQSHWEGLKYLKQQGFKYANFGGITRDTANSWSGFSKFKRRFGGFEVDHGPYFDYVHKPVLYRAYLARKRVKNIWS